MHAVRALDEVLRIEPLQLALDRFHRLRVEQLAQLRIAEQFAQLRLIDGQRLRAPFGERRVAVVDEARDVAEQQRCRERRRGFRVDGGDAHFPAPDVSQRADQRRHVEDIAQALAIGLEQHRERAVARRHGQQIRGALPLLPQRRALAGTTAGQEQRAGGVLAELRGEERRGAELAHDQRLHFLGIGQQQPRLGRRVHVRKPDDEPVVSPERLDVDPRLFADLRRDRHRPRRVNPPAARRQDAHAPVAELVAHAFDDHRRRVGKGPRRRRLIAQVLQQVLGRARIEIVLARQLVERRGR